MSTPEYDPQNPPTQEMYPSHNTPYSGGLHNDAYQTQRAYSNTADADYGYTPAAESAPARPQAQKQPTGLAARFDVNQLTVDIITNALVTGIVTGIMAIVAELILQAFIPTEWPLNPFGVAFWCAASFIAVLIMVAFGFIGAAIDEQSNSESLYLGLSGSFIVLALALFALPIGFNWVLVAIFVFFIPMTITLLKVPTIVDNHRLATNTE